MNLRPGPGFQITHTLLDDSARPRVFYKGAPAGLREFRANPHSGLIHVAPNERQAQQFQGDGCIYRVAVSAQQVFDARDPSARASLLAALEDQQVLRELTEVCGLGTAIEINGADDVLNTFRIGIEGALYQSLELPCVVDWIRAQGFDGFWVHEDEGDAEANLAVFQSSQIVQLGDRLDPDALPADARLKRLAELDALRLSPRANDLDQQLAWTEERNRLALQLALTLASDPEFVGLSLPQGSGHIGVHPSTKDAQAWQVTHFDLDWAPCCDTGEKSVLAALKELLDECRPSLIPGLQAEPSPEEGPAPH